MALLSVFAAGCSSTNGTSTAPAGAVSAATVALKSVEGAPAEVAEQLMQAFDERARAHQVIIVSREGLPHYRIRGLFSARSERGRTTVAWVWDVYDSQNRRTHHIAGEEILGPGDRDPWASVDLEAVGRIAKGGVEPLVAFLVSPSVIAAADATPRAPVPVSDDFTPEASGIFRVFRSVWPKSEDKKPPVEEPPARTPDASTARRERRVVGTDHPTNSTVPARLQ